MSRRARSSLAVDGARAAGGQDTDTGRGGESDARHVARRAAPARAGSIIGSLKSLLGIKNKAEVRKGNVDAALPILHVLFCAFVVAGRTRDRQRTQGSHAHSISQINGGSTESPRKRKRAVPPRVVAEPRVLHDEAASTTSSSDTDPSDCNGAEPHLRVDEQPEYNVIEFDDLTDSESDDAANTRATPTCFDVTDTTVAASEQPAKPAPKRLVARSK